MIKMCKHVYRYIFYSNIWFELPNNNNTTHLTASWKLILFQFSQYYRSFYDSNILYVFILDS